MNMYSIFNIQVLGKKKNDILLKHLYSLTRSEIYIKWLKKYLIKITDFSEGTMKNDWLLLNRLLIVQITGMWHVC